MRTTMIENLKNELNMLEGKLKVETDSLAIAGIKQDIEDTRKELAARETLQELAKNAEAKKARKQAMKAEKAKQALQARLIKAEAKVTAIKAMLNAKIAVPTKK